MKLSIKNLKSNYDLNVFKIIITIKSTEIPTSVKHLERAVERGKESKRKIA